MRSEPSSHEDSAAELDRRGFLSRIATSAMVAGSASPALNMLALFPAPAATPGSVFRPGVAESDAAIFAEARKHFLIPKGVTYCNTGTLGASPREVVDALVNGTRALEEVGCDDRHDASTSLTRAMAPDTRASTTPGTRW